MLKNRIQYLILLAASAGVCLFTAQYFALILLLFLLILPAISFLLLILAYRKITVDFEVPDIINKAEAAAAKLTLCNFSFFPVSGVVVRICCRNNLTGEEISTKTFCTIEGRENRTFFELSDTHAGRITVALTRIEVCDILSLFSITKKRFDEKSALIYPEPYDVKIEMEKQEEITGDGGRYSQTKKGQDVNEIFALREYLPGDEIRKIHWKLSARQNRLVVRDFALDLNQPVFLLLEAFDRQGENSGEVLDTCMTAFVSVSRSFIKKGICHNIAWYDSQRQELIIKEIQSADGLEAYMPELLSIRSYHDDSNALRFYEAYSSKNQSVLYYITTKASPDEIAKRALYQTVKTVYVTEDSSAADSSIVTVRPRSTGVISESFTI